MSTSTGVQCAEIQEILKIFEKRLSDMEQRIIELEQQLSDTKGNNLSTVESSGICTRLTPELIYDKEELLNIRSTIGIQSIGKPPQMKTDYRVVEDGETTIRIESERRKSSKPTATLGQDEKSSLAYLINSYKQQAALRAQKGSGHSGMAKHENLSPEESASGEALKGKTEMIFGLVVEYPPGEEPDVEDYSIAKVT